MSDDPRVTVPAELVDALREAHDNWPVGEPDAEYIHGRNVRAAVRRLLDATERPAAPVSEPLCRCGHAEFDHEYDGCVVGVSGERCACERSCERFRDGWRHDVNTRSHDATELNEIARIVTNASDRHPLFSVRYGIACAILESEWLAQRDKANWNEGHAMCCDEPECGGTYEGTPHPTPAPVPVSDEAEAGLSEDEHEAMRLTVQLVEVVCRKIIGDGESRSGDVNEFVADIHRIQNRIMAQAAGRAHPESYRLLGAGFRAARQAGKEEQP